MNIKNLSAQLKTNNLEEISPNYKKGMLSEEEVNTIIKKVAKDIETSEEIAFGGIMLLMLKGAASSGTPTTLSVDLKDGKTLAKRNVMGAYLGVTGNNYIRRLAESIAVEIGEFAEYFNLPGELSQRINTTLKAESGEMLTPKEMAWCSSFSQNIPNLSERSSDRLVKLLAEDYKKRFDNRKKLNKVNTASPNPKKGRGAK